MKLGERSYPIQTGKPLKGLGVALKQLPKFKNNLPKKALIVSHSFLYRRYGPALKTGLNQEGIQVLEFLIPEGEHQKTLATAQKIYQKCVREKLDRTSILIAFGGGVIGDVAGFAAATYLRGIPVIQVPTTLLAMVDSSIGGKTGVDLPESKNSVGAFHQPSLVWMDTATLKTLPRREFRNGLAEVIKYSVIADPALFSMLEKNVSALASGRSPLLPSIISRCAQIKADVVSKDERETKGLRETLNFGHTMGHAIETVTRYKAYKHGEAISIGMCAAGFMAVHLKLWSREDQTRLEKLILNAGLPARLRKKLPENEILNALTRDKKVKHGNLRFVLPVKIGKTVALKIPTRLALRALQYVQP